MFGRAEEARGAEPPLIAALRDSQFFSQTELGTKRNQTLKDNNPTNKKLDHLALWFSSCAAHPRLLCAIAGRASS